MCDEISQKNANCALVLPAGHDEYLRVCKLVRQEQLVPMLSEWFSALLSTRLSSDDTSSTNNALVASLVEKDVQKRFWVHGAAQLSARELDILGLTTKDQVFLATVAAITLGMRRRCGADRRTKESAGRALHKVRCRWLLRFERARCIEENSAALRCRVGATCPEKPAANVAFWRRPFLLPSSAS